MRKKLKEKSFKSKEINYLDIIKKGKVMSNKKRKKKRRRSKSKSKGKRSKYSTSYHRNSKLSSKGKLTPKQLEMKKYIELAKNESEILKRSKEDIEITDQLINSMLEDQITNIKPKNNLNLNQDQQKQAESLYRLLNQLSGSSSLLNIQKDQIHQSKQEIEKSNKDLKRKTLKKSSKKKVEVSSNPQIIETKSQNFLENSMGEKETNFWEDLVDVNDSSKGVYSLRDNAENIPFIHTEDEDDQKRESYRYDFKTIVFMVVVFTIPLMFIYENIQKMMETKIVYCDTYQEPSIIDQTGELCTKCPENAQCQNGMFKCNIGFIKKKQSCIINEEVNLFADQYLQDISYFLSLKNGQKLCNKNERDELTFNEAKDYIKKLYNINNDKLHEDLIFPKMQKILQKSNKDNQIHGLYNSPLRLANSSSIIKSTERITPLLCSLQLLIIRNLPFCCIIIIVFTLIFKFYNKIKKSKRVTALSKQNYQKIKQKLNVKQEICVKELQSELRKDLKTDSYLEEDVWKAIKELRKIDESIVQYKDSYGNQREEYFWSLIQN